MLYIERLESRDLLSNYFVAPFGDDRNPGTEDDPFLTIQRAADIVNPGDNVFVLGFASYDGFRIHRSGTPQGLISFLGYDGPATVISNAAGADAGIVYDNVEHVWVYQMAASNLDTCVRMAGGDELLFSTSLLSGCGVGVSVEGTGYVQMHSNNVSSGTTGVQFFGVGRIYMAHNTIVGMSGDGVYVDTLGAVGEFSPIEGNTIDSNGGYGMVVHGATDYRLRDNRIRNNTLGGVFTTNAVNMLFELNEVNGGGFALSLLGDGFGNVVVSNALLGGGSIHASSGQAPFMYSDFNVVTDLFMLDGLALSLSEWQEATGLDPNSVLG